MKKEKQSTITISKKPLTLSAEERDAVYESFDELSRKLSAIERLVVWLERTRLNDYVLLMGNTKRIFWINVLSGVGRGLGFTFGFLLLGGLFLYILNQFINLPLIGDFIAELLKYIEDVKGLRI